MLSKDPTVWLRNRKLQHDKHLRLAKYTTFALHSHQRPVAVLPRHVRADTPDGNGYRHVQE